jgi:RHS repeat-associated protein
MPRPPQKCFLSACISCNSFSLSGPSHSQAARQPRLLEVIFCILCVMTLCANRGNCQNPTPTLPYSIDGNGVNEADLEVIRTFPIFAKDGRKMAIDFNAILYNGYWSVYVNPNTSQASWVGGTRFLLPSLFGGIGGWKSSEKWGSCGSPAKEVFFKSGYFIFDKQGMEHDFGFSVYTANTCGLNPTSASGYASDLSGYYTSVGTGNNSIIAPDGTSFVNAILTDSNGNQITSSYNPSTFTWSYTDTLGKAALTATIGGNVSNPNPTVYTYQGPNGPRSVTIHYAPFYFATNFGCSGIWEATPAFDPTYLPVDITYPDGSKYLISYEATPGNPNATTGRVSIITLPSGGSIAYAYPGIHDGIVCVSGGQNSWPGGFLSNLSVTKAGGTWTYSRSATAGQPVVTTVSGPGGQSKVDTFQGWSGGSAPQYLPVQSKIYNGTLLAYTIDSCYDGHAAPCTGQSILSRLSRVTTTTLSGGLSSKMAEAFVSPALLPSSVSLYDFGSALISTKTVQYGSFNSGSCATLGNEIVDRPCQVTVTDGSGTVVSQTSYAYDEGSLTPTTGSPNLVSIAGSRGNVTTVSRLVTGTTTLKSSSTYFDTGLPNVATDVNGSQISYTHGACGNSLTTNEALPLNLAVAQTWEPSCNGAVLTSETDPNGKVESITYGDSNIWRPTNVTDELQNAANIKYLYDGSNHPIAAEMSLLFNSNNSVADIRTNVDGYGRPSVSQILKGPGGTSYDSTEVDYNTLGLAYRSTVPYQASAGGTNGSVPATLTTYDALGRVSTVTDGGGGTVSYCYYPSASGGCVGTTQTNDVLVTVGPAPAGENAKKKQYESDGLGRLTSVCEVSTTLSGTGTCGQTVPQTGYWTKYAYNAIGNLLSITQNAQSASPQVRSFTYDDLGRRLTEYNPESGTTQFFYDTAPSTPGVSCTNPTFTGDLVKTYDANGNTICNEYDALRRLTATKYPGGPNAARTDEKHYVYDSATVGGQAMQNGSGRLVEAYTGLSTAKLTDIGYSYTDRGQVAAVYQETPNSHSSYQTVNYTYYENGAISGMTTNISGLPSFAFVPNGQGQLQMVTSSDVANPILISNVVYNNAGQPTEIDFSYGKKDTFLYDANTLRWEKGTFNAGASSIVVDPAWNLNGSVHSDAITDPNNAANNQTCTFKKDDDAQLASVDCGASIWQQNFSYDAFGNITKTVPLGGTGTSWIPGYNQANNHYSLGGTTYDNNGNLLTDTFHTYQWDSDNNLTTVDSLPTTYDAFGTEVEWKVGSAFYQSVDTALGRIIAKNLVLDHARISFVGGVIAKYNASALEAYYHSDWRGNVVVATTPSGGYLGSSANAPFGEEYAINNLANFFMGLGSDTVSGETDTATRKFHWASGRFIEPDPSGSVDLVNPRSLNLYAYVNNAPMESADPSGLQTGDCENCKVDVKLIDPEKEGKAGARGMTQEDVKNYGFDGAYLRATINNVTSDSGWGGSSITDPQQIREALGGMSGGMGSGSHSGSSHVSALIWNATSSKGKGNWGHAATILSDGTYISWWPGRANDPQNPNAIVEQGGKHFARNARTPSYASDVSVGQEGEGHGPDQWIDIYSLNETAIRRWWNGFQQNQLWDSFDRNCSDAAMGALVAGGSERFVRQPRNLIAPRSPSDVLKYAQSLQLRNPTSGGIHFIF